MMRCLIELGVSFRIWDIMNPKDAYKEHLEYWQKAKQEYLVKMASCERKIKEASTPVRKQCYEGLKKLWERQVDECDRQLVRLLTIGGGERNIETGS